MFESNKRNRTQRATTRDQNQEPEKAQGPDGSKEDPETEAHRKSQKGPRKNQKNHKQGKTRNTTKDHENKEKQGGPEKTKGNESAPEKP